jgi:hypothetical protein
MAGKITVPITVTFELIDFNPRRHARGVEAARVEVIVNGDSREWLWMSERDIKANIAEFGDSEELQKALAEYRKHQRRA